jgi:integrase/recombinase XerD
MPFIAYIVPASDWIYIMKYIQRIEYKQNKHDWQATLQRLDGAYAEGTLRAYRSDIRTYVVWCGHKNLDAFPAKANQIAEFVSSSGKRCSSATIKRRLAAISKIHRLMRMENPVADEEVKLALRRILRRNTIRPKQAMGMTKNIRDRLIEVCDESPLGKRDRAIIALGYDTLCRRSEIIAVNYEDIAISENGAKILIRRSKNDQFGAGRVAYITNRTFSFLLDWLKIAEITNGAIFRGIKHDKIQPCPLHPNSISRIIKLNARRAGLSQDEVQYLSSHSMRIGAAQDMMNAGFNILPIMTAGGWKTTNVVARYIENTDISTLLQSYHR